MRFNKERKVAICAIEENIAYVCCLERQQKFLKSKAKDMLCCSLKTIDKLDTAKEKERKEREQVASSKNLALFNNFVNFSFNSNLLSAMLASF